MNSDQFLSILLIQKILPQDFSWFNSQFAFEKKKRELTNQSFELLRSSRNLWFHSKSLFIFALSIRAHTNPNRSKYSRTSIPLNQGSRLIFSIFSHQFNVEHNKINYSLLIDCNEKKTFAVRTDRRWTEYSLSFRASACVSCVCLNVSLLLYSDQNWMKQRRMRAYFNNNNNNIDGTTNMLHQWVTWV